MNLSEKPFYLTENENRTLDEWRRSLSLEQKVGQLFCILADLYSDAKLTDLIQNKGIGGVLFRPDTLSNIQASYAKLDALARIPLLKAANLEDGASGALNDGTRYSSELGVAATNDPAFARELALSASYEARKAGINITFSPDSDIDFNCFNPITNERTYGSDPHRVKAFVETEVRAFLANGMLPCIKHFPGDGVDFRDQHLLPSYNSLSYSAWEKSYGQVYRAAIRAGVPCLMVGHIACPALSYHADPSISFAKALPASLSPSFCRASSAKKWVSAA
jgi:beta-N-acetylhexosaminidase